MENVRTHMLLQNVSPPLQSTDEDGSNRCCTNEDLMIASREDQSVGQTCTEHISTSQIHDKPSDNLIDCNSAVFSGPVAHCSDFFSSNDREELSNVSEVVSSSLEGSEPIYEGEEHILESGLSTAQNREPVYEGEVVLAEQADKTEEDNCSTNLKDEVARHQWQLIKNFLENNASQLTIYGLFCLQEGIKERELCVFFRNNHFCTMFKFNSELYLLATDQGYLNQPDLVWEKLNEVNGDTAFMTGNFVEFKTENHINNLWNEQNAMTSTADYLASLERSSPSGSTVNSDLQLAIALQQQEFEQQPQRQQQQYSQQPPVTSRSRLVTGSDAPRNSNASQKSGPKAKDRCIVM
ncbi:putative ubiquitin carboxyl-terminal hydrolase MINDY-1 [Cocos nucifera]|uniref:Putative ubiquitin carboxyl-terminal hydrolase MINDY-1 n=1 Tax=Cocos nucifera TaxID=13894 RepID=A0A8K0IHS1_COCNU|nr:putative ubiquitin carboxyl-terminal hydrolase MINDY-1 [Cocos nucifera]